MGTWIKNGRLYDDTHPEWRGTQENPFTYYPQELLAPFGSWQNAQNKQGAALWWFGKSQGIKDVYAYYDKTRVEAYHRYLASKPMALPKPATTTVQTSKIDDVLNYLKNDLTSIVGGLVQNAVTTNTEIKDIKAIETAQATGGSQWTMIAIIGAVVLVALYFFKK